jgi:hypothetical protein
LNLTYSDSAAAFPPDAGPLVSGTFKPSDVEVGDAFVAPAPAGSYGDPAPVGSATLTSVFAGTDPNGTWSLYVVDDTGADVGSISGGWCLAFGPPAADPAATVTPPSFTFSVAADDTASDTLNIANAAGSSPLTYSIESRSSAQPVASDSDESPEARAMRDAIRSGKVTEEQAHQLVTARNVTVRAAGPGIAGRGIAGTCAGAIIPWITANPASGSVPGGGDTDVTVKVDPAAGGLTPGNYPAELCVTTNDPLQTLISVPVDVTVTPGDAIFCSGFEDGETGACAPAGGGETTPGPWTTGATGPPLRYRAGGASDGTYVYVYGGSNDVAAYLDDLWRWDPATESWTQLASMPTGKSNIQGAYLDGKIYVPGGYIGSHITENAIYDIATDTWTTGAALPIAHSGATAAYNGKIYDFGGNGANTQLDIYDPATDTWAPGAPFPTNITYGRAITVGDYIYYVGGIEDGATTTAAVWRYDPVADAYTAMAPLQTARTSAELMTDGNRIFAVNGGDATFFAGIPLAQTVEIYDILTDTWTYGLPTVQTSAGPGGGKAGGKLMIQGGVDGTTYLDTTQVSTLIPD